MENGIGAVRYPELVFGIAGALGVSIEDIISSLSDALAAVSYQSVTIHVTQEIAAEATNVPRPSQNDFAVEANYKMDHANAVCRKYGGADTLMRFAIKAIRRHRAERAGGDSDLKDTPSEEQVVPKTAFIIRQLKRPEEVQLLRKVYGKQFILVSAYGSEESRRSAIETKLKRTLPLNTPEYVISCHAEELLHRDQNEGVEKTGQHLRDTFHLADVFVDGIAKSSMQSTINRFVNAFFGRTDIAPTKVEYGIYAAKSASLRSTDLSRQVGAALFSREGEVIAQGCNEVPKAFGGTYWDGEEPDFRDVKLGYDPNDILKKEVVRDLLERLSKGGMLSDQALAIGPAAQIVDALLKKPGKGDPEGHGCLAEAAITDLTEYGRVVHAEMGAICDAARLGRAVRGSVLYCTTFPCHNCTKHLLAAGIAQVVYVEPYPKSKAKELHENEVELERLSSERVSFMPFIGISPFRYRDIFEKGRRKTNGSAIKWISGEPKPMIDLSAPTYIDLESFEYLKLGHQLRASKLEATPTQ
jgi:deoxycytidylate deaminase